MEKRDLTKPEVVLSASTISQLEDCSYLHYVKKVLKFPDPGNSGTSRGSTVHLIFELLLNPRHRHHYDIMLSQGVESSKSICRLIKKHLTKYGINESEHYEMVKEMIIVGLKNDFFGESWGGQIQEPEKEFLLEGDGYKIRGFIDKTILNGDKLLIQDYKSSKKQFPKEKLSSNIQAFAYTLAAKKKLWPHIKDVTVEFIFLRFPDNPIQQVKVTDSQLAGFEKYLAYMYNIVNNFSEDDARRNFAYDNPKESWRCKAGATWECPARRARDYYAIKQDGKLIKGAFMKEELDKIVKTGQTIERLRYQGCPRHNVCI